MHELSIASALVNTVAKHARGRPVAVVSVRAGRMRQVVTESLRFYFEIVARDTVCEQARLELTDVRARLRCTGCGEEWEPEWPVFRCPRCASSAVEVVAGEELEVEYIEVEEREPECTGPR
jgi:hydrogenase nickel incorporation protein HypA/HybF